VRHFTSARFWQNFNALPVEIQKAARANFDLLKQNPSHPSLQLKLVKNGRFRSVRATLGYRALGVQVPGGIQWFWIGSHADYDALLG
jgi:hypothetical protein